MRGRRQRSDGSAMSGVALLRAGDDFGVIVSCACITWILCFFS